MLEHLAPDSRRRAANIGCVKKTILVYGALGGLLIAALKLIEYRFLVVENSLEIYGGIVALLFSVLGIWLGLKLTGSGTNYRANYGPNVGPDGRNYGLEGGNSEKPFVRNAARLEQLGITRREMEILEAIASGLSNREIASRLYVSENTVKTHAASVFEKLNAKRRTQAVQLAKAAGLIP